MTRDRVCPSAFAELEPFAEKWCLATEAGALEHADGHAHAGDAVSSTTPFSPRLEEAIDYCDKFPLDDVPDDALNLLHLIYSMIMVSMAVEVFGTAEARRLRRRRHRPHRGAGAMSLLTINKLTDSVGAEVLGVDSDRLASDDAARRSGARGARRKRRAGVSRARISTRKRRWRSAAGSARSTTPRTGTILSPASTRSRSTSRRTPRRHTCARTFDWHIDGCTPIEDTFPQMATVLSAVQVAEPRRRDRVRQLLCGI